MDKLLTDSITARVTIHPVGSGIEAWRATIKFLTPEGAVISFGANNQTEYFLWMTYEFLEDNNGNDNSENSAANYALSFIEKRFDDTADDNGDRDLSRIREFQTTCISGSCHLGTSYNLPKD